MLNPATPANVREMVSAFRQFIGSNAMMAYLVMMAPRLVELRRVLKPTGSIYLHCDPKASHYLKVLMDAVFGTANFRNEITWRRSHPKGLAFTRFASNHDVILAYGSGESTTWNPVYSANPRAYEQYNLIEKGTGRRYQLTSLLNPNPDRPNLTYEFKGVTKVWRWTRERMEQADRDGLIVVPRGGNGIPRLKRYLDEQEGIPVGDTWDDIPIAAGKERLGYPTQKPLALLERIIQASSNEGDVVLDPFCGCGTAIAAAQKLNRSWIGIDITHLAVALMKNRLKTAFNILPGQDYQVVGEPVDVGSARALAEQDRFQFEFWAMSLLEAFPREQKKRGADQGVDGVVYFIDGPRRAVNKAVVQVKSGRVSSPLIRDLVGTVEREKAAMGLFITLEEPTRDMRTEAVSAGFYHSDLWQTDYPKIQIRTVGELLEGRAVRDTQASADVPAGAAHHPLGGGAATPGRSRRRGLAGGDGCHSEEQSDEESQAMREYYVYILTNETHRLYVGMTGDLQRRMYQHKHKLTPALQAGITCAGWCTTRPPQTFGLR